MKKEKKPYRLFFAIDLNAEAKTRLITIQDGFAELLGSKVAPANFHITLSFLGATSEKMLERLVDQIQPLSMKPFEISTQDLLYWPKPALLALSIRDQNQQLLEVKKQLEIQLRNLGFSALEKRDYIPHITLFRGLEKAPVENKLVKLNIKVNQVSLMLSENSRSGITYRILESWPLQSLSVKQRLLGTQP